MKSPVPKLFHQAWCNSVNPFYSPTIPPQVQHKTLEYMPPGFVYKCHTLRDMQSYLQETWGEDVLAAFDSYRKIPHKVDLWRYCILYEQGGIYMDADCVLKGDLSPLMQYDSVYVTNTRGLEDIFNGFIVTVAHSPVMKKMVQFMLELGKREEGDYLFNCKYLYSVLDHSIQISQGRCMYESPETGRMCLLFDKKMDDGRYHAFYEAEVGKEFEVLVETNDLYPYLNRTSRLMISILVGGGILGLMIILIALLWFIVTRLAGRGCA